MPESVIIVLLSANSGIGTPVPVVGTVTPAKVSPVPTVCDAPASLLREKFGTSNPSLYKVCRMCGYELGRHAAGKLCKCPPDIDSKRYPR